jgi:hypothetical protein
MNPVHKKKPLVEHVPGAGPDGPPHGALVEHLFESGVFL